MSGPKAIKLHEMPVRELRRKNQRLLDEFISGYERLESRIKSLNDRLELFGESSSSIRESAAELRRRLQHSIDSGPDGADLLCEATALKEKLVNQIQQAEQSLQTSIIALQKRYRQVGKDGTRLRNEVQMIEEQAIIATRNIASVSERDSITNLIEELKRTIAVPSAISVVLTQQGITNLEKVEAEVIQSNKHIQSFKKTLESKLDELQKKRNEINQPNNTFHKLSDFIASSQITAIPEIESSLDKLDNMLAEVAILQDTAGWTELLQKAEEIRQEPTSDRRRLLYEGLTIECGIRLRKVRAFEEWKVNVDRLLDSAAPFQGPGVDEIVKELHQLKRAGSIVDLSAIESRLNEAIQKSDLDQRTAEKRKAVLQALEELGYEVTDGMATALAGPGSVLLQKDTEMDYAVEVVTNSDLSIIQTTLVRFGDSSHVSEQDMIRDQEHEEAWCSEHAIIRQKVAAIGYESEFKMQLKPGEYPIKLIPSSKIKSASDQIFKVKAKKQQQHL
jgi:DNA repair exonuclease SbcCD ATPase subunit